MAKGSATIDITALKVAGEGASKYITAIDGGGIKVHDVNNINVNYALINAEGMEVFQGDTVADSVSVAKFGTVARIGTEEDANITIDDNSIRGVGASGKEFFAFENSLVRISTTKYSTLCSNRPLYYFPYGSGGLTHTLNETPSTRTNVKLLIVITDGHVVKKRGEIFWPVGTSGSRSVDLSITGYPYGTLSATYNGSNVFSNIRFSAHYTTDTTTNIRITVSYQIVDYAPAYKIGSEHTVTGAYAYAEGFGNTASGNYSHAEGSNTIAMAPNSHAEGYNTTAGKYENNVTSGSYAHAEGAYTIASGSYGHAEGGYTKAIGDYSHAQNRNTLASSYAQTAIGEYNIEDTNDTYAFIIGNGDSNNARSNALTVDWNGKIETAGGIEADGNITTWGHLIAAGDISVTGCYDSLYKITSFQHSINGGINANSYVSADTISIPSASRVDGYNLVGIVGHSSNYFRVQPTTNYVTSNTSIYAGFANWSATNVTANVTVTFWLLWLRATEG